MANKFILWCEDENATQDYDTFVNDNQRQAGFQGGQPASAIRVNTALRQANLVSAALMNALLPDNQTLNYRNDIPTVANAINTALNTRIKTTKVNNASQADNATNANIAQYASDDISKGTIEERLTNLGFRQGSFSISLKTGAAPTITTNSIVRQGNYCIGSFDIGYAGPGANIYLNEYNVIIPEEFRPLVDTTITCFQTRGGISTVGYDTAILKTTGEVIFSGLNASLTTATAINIGWEAAAIS